MTDRELKKHAFIGILVSIKRENSYLEKTTDEERKKIILSRIKELEKEGNNLLEELKKEQYHFRYS